MKNLTDKQCNDMPVRELSEISGIPEAAIRSRKQRGKTGKQLIRKLVPHNANIGNRRHKKGNHPWRKWVGE